MIQLHGKTYMCGCGDPRCSRGCFGGVMRDGMRGLGHGCPPGYDAFGATPMDVLLSAGNQALSDTTLAFLQSPQFAPFLDAVKQKAREGVIEETKSNAITLLVLSASAGAVGGYVFNGNRGLILGGVVAALAVSRLMRGHA